MGSSPNYKQKQCDNIVSPVKKASANGGGFFMGVMHEYL
jgi:hypothetical protein